MSKTIKDLRKDVADYNVKGYSKMKRGKLVEILYNRGVYNSSQANDAKHEVKRGGGGGGRKNRGRNLKIHDTKF